MSYFQWFWRKENLDLSWKMVNGWMNGNIYTWITDYFKKNLKITQLSSILGCWPGKPLCVFFPIDTWQDSNHECSGSFVVCTNVSSPNWENLTSGFWGRTELHYRLSPDFKVLNIWLNFTHIYWGLTDIRVGYMDLCTAMIDR